MSDKGKYQFIQGKWPELKPGIKVKLTNPESIITPEEFQKYINSFKAIQHAAKEASEAMGVLSGYDFGSDYEPLGRQVGSALARCMAKIYGPNCVSMDWDQSLQAGLTKIVIAVENGKDPYGKPMWAFQFTDEYVFSIEKQSMLTVEQCVFLDLLPKLCDHFDHCYKLQFVLPMNKMSWEPHDLWDVNFNKTTSSYEYLTSTRFLETLLRYWIRENNGYAPPDKWLEETAFIDGVAFNTGGYVDSPLLEGTEMSDSAYKMRQLCPALTLSVALPCGCSDASGTAPLRLRLEKAIIHLNDLVIHGRNSMIRKEWSREEIADWLESLDLDLTLRDNSVTTEKENE